MPPMMTTTSEASRNRVSSPGEIDWNVPPTTPAMPASPAPKAKTTTKTSWIAHAHRRQNVAVVDAGAHDHADARAIEDEPHRRRR